ncbi:hypothetical protein LCGC14_1584020 [marine sediment metagenome]|uniref:GATA-type domain-containing protein n=1 Tax=marine sediment metagenome TaxID=412755 RepID=A0A0F9KWQ5_9ZZZZ
MAELCKACGREYGSDGTESWQVLLVTEGMGLRLCRSCFVRATVWAARRALAEEKSQGKLTAMGDRLDEIKDGLTAKGNS